MDRDKLTPLEKLFIEWSSRRKGISEPDATAQYLKSRAMFKGGFGGAEYRRFCVRTHDALFPVLGDEPSVASESYKAFGAMHLLRMLSYPQGRYEHLAKLAVRRGTVLDFGCGLAQISTSIAKRTKSSLVLCDIDTVKLDFAVFAAMKMGVDTTSIECGESVPLDWVVDASVVVATEVLEHLSKPLQIVMHLDKCLSQGGLLITNVADHHKERFHVSTNLAEVRAFLGDKYEELEKHKVFVKL